jgi:hypothetical protein
MGACSRLVIARPLQEARPFTIRGLGMLPAKACARRTVKDTLCRTAGPGSSPSKITQAITARDSEETTYVMAQTALA